MTLLLPHPVHFLTMCCLKPSQVPLVWVLLDLCSQMWLCVSSWATGSGANGPDKAQGLLPQRGGLGRGNLCFYLVSWASVQPLGQQVSRQGWKHLSWVICTEHAGGMAQSELCTPPCFGVEKGSAGGAPEGASGSALLQQRRARKPSPSVAHLGAQKG